MSRCRKILGIVMVVVLLAAGVWLWSETQPFSPARLRSGAVITLAKVTYGREHRFVHGSLWQRLRARLPEKLFGKSGAITIAHRTTNDCAIAWLVWKGSNALTVGGRPSSYPSYIMVNDRDQRLRTAGLATVPGPLFLLHPVDRETLIDGRELVLPRKDKIVRLRLYDVGTNSHLVPVGEFKISNPSPKNPPVWKAEPLPIRRTDGNVEFTLIELTADMAVRRGFLTAQNRLTFQIAENGERTTNWQLRFISASDALGNHNVYGCGSYPYHNGTESWEGPLLLWPDEPVWKLCLEFVRRGGSAPDELWLAQGIPVPGRDSFPFQPKTFQTNLQGVLLFVRGISDGRGLLPDGQMSVSASSNVLVFGWSPVSPSVRFSLLEVTDDRGQKVPFGNYVQGDRGTVGCKLPIAGDVQSVNALFHVSRSRVVEFIAKPELISTNSSAAGGK